MLAIVGTIPDPDAPLLDAPLEFSGDTLSADGVPLPPDRGTPALIGAAAITCRHLDLPLPHTFLVGDEGLGAGSRKLYAHLESVLPNRDYSTLVFHYLQPDVDWHNKVLLAAQSMKPCPKLIADAGFMYAAKMSGEAPAYDLFTPDAGELAFLADETAPHPFYTRGFVLQDENRVDDLAARAFKHGNAASCLLIKGKTDRVADKSGVLSSVSHPSVEAMEAMGGTGDTITGMACALVEYGLPVAEAGLIAAQANRYAGESANPNPGSRIGELLPHLPAALARAMEGRPA